MESGSFWRNQKIPQGVVLGALTTVTLLGETLAALAAHAETWQAAQVR